MERQSQRGGAGDPKIEWAPPCDIEAEWAVLAVVLLDPSRIRDVTAALTPADFADDANRTVFAAMLRLQRRGLPPDATRLVGELCATGQYNGEHGVSVAALVDLFRLFPLVQHLPQYLDRLLEMSRRRHEKAPGI